MHYNKNHIPFYGRGALARFFRKLRLKFTILLIFLLPLTAAAQTATNTWTGNASSGKPETRRLWDNADNWTGGTPVAGSVLVFDGANYLTDNNNNLVAGFGVWSIFFAAGAGAFVLDGGGGGGSITLTNGITNSSANTQTLNINGITLGGAQTFNALSNNLVFTSTNNITNAGFLLTIAGSSNTIVESVISGSGGLTKTGTGTLTLSNANTYTGGTLLNEGALRLANASAGGSGAITQSNGLSTLIIDTTGTVTNAMSIFTLRSWQTVTLSGAKTLNSATSYDVTNATTTTESGVLTGAGGITKIGAGTLALAASNNFTGAVVISNGVLNLNSASGFAAGAATSVSVFTGATLLISQNSLTQQGDAQVNNAASVTLSGGTITLAGSATPITEVFGNLTVDTASFLDFGAGPPGTLSFGTYNTPSSLLTVNNFQVYSKLTFGSDLSSTINNTNLFAFDGAFASSWDSGTSTFTITAVPEPSAYLAATALLGLLFWPSRKRILRHAKSILGVRARLGVTRD